MNEHERERHETINTLSDETIASIEAADTLSQILDMLPTPPPRRSEPNHDLVYFLKIALQEGFVDKVGETIDTYQSSADPRLIDKVRQFPEVQSKLVREILESDKDLSRAAESLKSQSLNKNRENALLLAVPNERDRTTNSISSASTLEELIEIFAERELKMGPNNQLATSKRLSSLKANVDLLIKYHNSNDAEGSRIIAQAITNILADKIITRQGNLRKKVNNLVYDSLYKSGILLRKFKSLSQ